MKFALIIFKNCCKKYALFERHILTCSGGLTALNFSSEFTIDENKPRIHWLYLEESALKTLPKKKYYINFV